MRERPIEPFAIDLGLPAPTGRAVLVCARAQGRRAARRAAIAGARHRLGLPERAVGRDGLGGPVWPPGERGSLSHWRDLSLCLLLRGADFDPGVDLEGFADVEARRAIRQEALSPAEAVLLDRAGLPEGAAEALAFSAKESFFKAASPRIGRRIGYDAAEICAPPTREGLLLRIAQGLGPALPAGAVVPLAARLFEGAALTWLLLPAR